jgi:hypothetical protein
MRLPATLPLLLVAGLGLLRPSPAEASLTTFATFVGSDSLSTDGCGSITQTCSMAINVPVGSTVLGAYLYSSLFSASVTPGGTLNGSPVTYSTALGVDAGILQAWRANVTSLVQGVVGGGSAAPFNFTVTETDGSQDGEALVVVYSNPALPTQTVGILDGFSASTGDTATINFATPLNPSAPGFVADMRIGDGFSFDGTDPANPDTPGQSSTITVNGTVITNNAGHCDDARDASCTNGNLITVGADNDPFSPLLPTLAQDHERYNLTPELTTGETSITIGTLNPSNNDNIFLETFLITGIGGVNAPPPNSAVPEPGTLSLLGMGVVAVARRFRRR